MENWSEAMKAIGRVSIDLATALASIVTAALGVATAYNGYRDAKNAMRRKRKLRKKKVEESTDYETDEAG